MSNERISVSRLSIHKQPEQSQKSEQDLIMSKQTIFELLQGSQRYISVKICMKFRSVVLM